MSSATLVPTSLIVGASTTLTVTFTPAHSIASGGYIKVTFPKWNPSASSANQLDYL